MDRCGSADTAIGGVRLSLTVLLSVFLAIVRLQAIPGTVELSGVVLDPSGNVIAGASITVVSAATRAVTTVFSDGTGRYSISDLPVGTYRVRVEFSGFAPYSRDITLDQSGQRNLSVTLKLAGRRESLTIIPTSSDTDLLLGGVHRDVDADDRARSLATAGLLVNAPGESLRDNGALAGLPILHGLDDERVKVVANGMTVSPSCPNHMNPPLFYISPSAVAQVDVMAGITPVSLGGDSIGGTIVVDSPPPVFATAGEGIHAEGVFSTVFRSNGESYGPSLAASISNRHFSLGYNATWTSTDDYNDGAGRRVTSRYSQNTSHALTMAAQSGGNLFDLQMGFQNTPFEGFTNQQVDMVGNRSEFVNVSYRWHTGTSAVDARLFWRNVRHEMNIGRDKSSFLMAMWMPMDTHGRDLGYRLKWTVPVSPRHTIQIGTELQRFALDSIWPAVAGTDPVTGPDPFVSVNGGRRTRAGFFAEASSRWTDRWTTLLGVRSDTVWSKTGPVSGYSTMYSMDADAFNALNRARIDHDVDVTALARYEPDATVSIEAGYARKTRAPNLYERYAWSTDLMTSSMINWFGDGNAYVGNVDLRPEVAQTVSATVSWHDRPRAAWNVSATLYQTDVRDYIDVDQIATQVDAMSTVAQLMFANHDARIRGIDVTGTATIWTSTRFGRGELTGVGAWLRGRRLDTGTGLYQMMPLNARIGLVERFKAFTGGPEIQLVDRKRDTDPLRFEPHTAGYALVNVNAGYQWRRLRLQAGGSNLLNRWYELPLGGVNVDEFLASGGMGRLAPLTGPGRSLYSAISIPF